MTALPTLGGNFAQAYAVNDAGGRGRRQQPGRRAGAARVLLDAHGRHHRSRDARRQGEPRRWRINSTGQVVGYSDLDGRRRRPADDPSRGRSTGGMVDLGSLGGTNGRAVAVNDGGQVVGWSAPSEGGAAHGFSWTPGDGMVDLDLPGSTAMPRAVTDTGLIIGSSTDFGAIRRRNALAGRRRLVPPCRSRPERRAPARETASVTVSWAAQPATAARRHRYTVTSSPGGATARSTPGTTQATVHRPDNGTTYTFAVTAGNARRRQLARPRSPTQSLRPRQPAAGRRLDHGRSRRDRDHRSDERRPEADAPVTRPSSRRTADRSRSWRAHRRAPARADS